ncbi:S26 family signal peptidase [Agreia sp. COWG]|uniref:S26 family signal peptidase n=1 Tax=Agreia sp. COWG TaxID=2773266 RepID=UPI001925D7C7|nr:S26 family signal peptidase [Agreia sp. COWG]CAD5991079.1 S26 family signal peptidase [Agreia sp. COWG]
MTHVAEIRGTRRADPPLLGGFRGLGLAAKAVLARIRDAALALAALAGVAAIGWGVATLFFGFSLVTFATGSMAPTIPTGSIALVREVPASQLEIGQVVTLQRGGERLPITHRITDITPNPAVRDGFIISMQGDANAIPDVFPYYVKRGKVVLWSAAGGQAVSDMIGSPVTLIAITAGAGALVLWAFWPRGRTVERTGTSTSTSSIEPQRRGERRHAR